jgi:hypothetical protein
MGIGTRLFDRAAIHCRNADVDTLYMHFLSSNQSMMHIAKKAEMEVHHDHGEAEAYLKLPPADAASASQEVVDRFLAAVPGAGTEPPALKKTSSPTREVTMMKLPILILGFALTATTIADAAQVAGVSVPDSATVAGTKLMLNGAGLRKKAFFEVYVGVLYLPSKAASAEAALGQNGPNRVAMHFLRDVDRESLVDAWSEGFARNSQMLCTRPGQAAILSASSHMPSLNTTPSMT